MIFTYIFDARITDYLQPHPYVRQKGEREGMQVAEVIIIIIIIIIIRDSLQPSGAVRSSLQW